MFKTVVRGQLTSIEAHLPTKKALKVNLEIIVVLIARRKSVAEIPIN